LPRPSKVAHGNAYAVRENTLTYRRKMASFSRLLRTYKPESAAISVCARTRLMLIESARTFGPDGPLGDYESRNLALILDEGLSGRR